MLHREISISNIGSYLMIFFGLIIAFSTIDYDDNMYWQSSLNGGASYDTNAYLQMPFGLIFWQCVFALTKSYLIMRFVSLALLFASIFILRGLLSKERRVLFLFLVLSSYSILSMGNLIGSYSLAIFLTSSALYFLVKKNNNRLFIAISGVLFSLAILSKINIILFAPFFLLMSLRIPKANKYIFTLTGALTLLTFSVFYNQYFVINNFTLHKVWMPEYRMRDYSSVSLINFQNIIKDLSYLLFRHNLPLLISLLVTIPAIKLTKKNLLVLGFVSASIVLMLLAKDVFTRYVGFMAIPLAYLVSENCNLLKLKVPILFLSILVSSLFVVSKWNNFRSFREYFSIQRNISYIADIKGKNYVYSMNPLLIPRELNSGQYMDSGIFYPRIGSILKERGLEINEYYNVTIWPGDNLEFLPSMLLFGRDEDKPYVTSFKNQAKKSGYTDSAYVGNYLDQDFYLLISQLGD